jgi:hypothetical protein
MHEACGCRALDTFDERQRGCGVRADIRRKAEEREKKSAQM